MVSSVMHIRKYFALRPVSPTVFISCSISTKVNHEPTRLIVELLVFFTLLFILYLPTHHSTSTVFATGENHFSQLAPKETTAILQSQSLDWSGMWNVGFGFSRMHSRIVIGFLLLPWPQLDLVISKWSIIQSESSPPCYRATCSSEFIHFHTFFVLVPDGNRTHIPGVASAMVDQLKMWNVGFWILKNT